jgi:hypothetical protein
MRIKTVIAFIGFFSMWCIQAVADTSRVSALLEALEKTVPAAYRDPVALVEKDDWSKEPDFRELQSLIVTDWATHAAAISTIAPSNNAKTIYFKAAQVLDRSTYLKFILVTSDRMAAKELHPMQFKWVVSPYEKHLRNMWVEDPPSDELKKVAARVREVMADDPGMVRFMNDVIRGEVAANNRDSDPVADPSEARKAQLRQSIGTAPAPAPAPTAVNPASARAAPLPAKSSNLAWCIVGLIILVSGAVFLVRKKTPGA